LPYHFPPARATLLALTVALALPAAASAAVTTSNVTSPADLSYFLDDDNATTAPSITVSGTSNGTTGDTVDIICTWDGTSTSTFANGVAVSADGAFSSTQPLNTIDDNTCILRATDPSDSGSPSAYHRYRGPRVAVSNLGVPATVPDGPNAGVVYGWFGSAQGLGGIFDFTATGDDGLEQSWGYTAFSWEDSYQVWSTGGEISGTDEGGSGTRSRLVVDGRNGYTAYDATSSFGDGDGGDPDSDELAGLPGITFTAQVDGPVTTFRESSQIVRCPTDTASPNAIDCTSWIATGIRLDRTWTVREGRLAGLSDVYTSTDGAAHTVNAITYSEVDTDELGYRFAGADHYEHMDAGVTFGAAEMGPGPFYFSGYEIDDDPDGTENAQFGVVYPASPAQLRWLGNERWETVWGDAAVSAGGSSAPQRQDFLQGVQSAQVARLTRAQADTYGAPVVSIATPAEGAVVPTDNVVVAGVVNDVSVASVTVNGVPAVVAQDGSYLANVPLARGANTLTVVATDTAGQTGTATRAVTYTEPARTRVAPAGVTRKLTPARDRKAAFRFRVAGRVVVPQGTSAGEACNGTMLIVVRAGKRILSIKTPKVLGDCTYRSGRFSYKSRNGFGKGRKKLTVSTRFTGNALLSPKSAARASFRVR
jgi:hypothetical protein